MCIVRQKWLAAWLVILICGIGFEEVEVAAQIRWDNAPATGGTQDGAGTWGNSSLNTNWWNGTLNVPWSPGATALIGGGLVTSATITLTNPIAAGGLIFSNSFTVTANGQGTPGYTIAGTAPNTNLAVADVGSGQIRRLTNGSAIDTHGCGRPCQTSTATHR